MPRRVKETASCLCPCQIGESLRSTFNKVRPPKPRALPAFPAFYAREPEMSRKNAEKWYKKHLPVSGKQAYELSKCYLDRMTGKKRSKKGKKVKKKRKKKKAGRPKLKKIRSIRERKAKEDKKKKED